MNEIPKVKYALIGGSGTWGARFPQDLNLQNVNLVSHIPRINTPYGLSAPFKLLEVDGEPVLRVAMHGCYPDSPNRNEVIHPKDSSRQVAWILEKSGVKLALVEASVGGIQGHLGNQLPVNSAVILDDFIAYCELATDFSAIGNNAEYFRLGRPFCSSLSQRLFEFAKEQTQFNQVLSGGVYALTPIGRFETPAEIRKIKRDDCHVVGQTIAHEAVALKKAGVHFAALTITSNIAESGVADIWIGNNHKAMSSFYLNCPHYVAPVIISTLKSVIKSGLPSCDCAKFKLTGLSQFPVKGA